MSSSIKPAANVVQPSGKSDSPGPEVFKEKEAVALVMRWQHSRSPQDAAQVLQAIQPMLEQGIYLNLGKTSDPIIRGYAKSIALNALRRYDPRKASLSTYLVTQLQGLKRYARKTTIPMSIPERRQYDYMVVLEAKTRLAAKLGRDPTVDEIADAVQFPASRVVRAMQIPGYISEGSATFGEQPFQEISGPSLMSAFPTFSRFDVDAVYDDLENPSDKKILEWRLGAYGNPQLSNKEIAKRLNISQSAVSQRWMAIRDKLLEVAQYSPLRRITDES